MTVRAAVVAALRDAGGLLLPQECAVCSRTGVACCVGCRPELQTLVRTVHGLAVHSGAVWDERTAAILRGLKEDGRTGLARVLSPALGAALRRAAAGQRVAVVPIPTGAAAFRRRGYRVPDLLLGRLGVPAVRLPASS
ncbi:hypothetical protein [Microbacterium gorillae]|uniref:hypothetical protein n=1 Tax=Microbacterium gorillae TaxID=1231063 RepID=UPI0011447313|nr:hypothetical protein [Microbacterium gorillae]